MWVPPGDYCENEYKRSSGVSQLEALAAIKRLQQTLVAGSITTTTIEAGSIKAAKLAGAVQPIGSLYHDRDGGALYRKTGKDTWTSLFQRPSQQQGQCEAVSARHTFSNLGA